MISDHAQRQRRLARIRIRAEVARRRAERMRAGQGAHTQTATSAGHQDTSGHRRNGGATSGSTG